MPLPRDALPRPASDLIELLLRLLEELCPMLGICPATQPHQIAECRGRANYRAGVVNADAEARYVAESVHKSCIPVCLGPEKSVKSCVARQVRVTHYLALVINGLGYQWPWLSMSKAMFSC